VCEEDFDKNKNMCRICVSTLCHICGKRLAIARCISCGKLGCKNCLVQVDPARYLCIDCYRELGENYTTQLRKAALQQARKLRNLESRILGISKDKTKV